MHFHKMHGLGNDFVLVDARDHPDADWPSIARRLGDRRFGVGFDQLLILAESAEADWRMDIYNPDGSRAEMCGNGIRCFMKYLRDAGLETRDSCVVETLAGPMVPRIVRYDGGPACDVEVDMGRPRLTPDAIPMRAPAGTTVAVPLDLPDGALAFTGVSMGNPHAVTFTPDLAALRWEQIGPQVQRHPAFPQSVNVEFVQPVSRGELIMRVWERGAGRTLACGTGACAATVAAVLNGLADRDVLVRLEGGDLRIQWREDDHVLMTGAATTVFSGTTAV